MAERKVSEAMRRVNAFIDGTGLEPSDWDLKCAALDSIKDLYAAMVAGDREAAAWAIDDIRNVADVMEDIAHRRASE